MQSALDYAEESLNQPDGVLRSTAFHERFALTLDELFTLPHLPLDVVLNHVGNDS